MRVPYRKPGKYSQLRPDPFMTKRKYAELKQALEKLRASQPEAAAEVSRLAELGDFSENAEYQLAKRRLRGINNRIQEVERQLDQAVIIEPKRSDTVQLGSTVTVLVNNQTKTYQILGSAETSPEKGIISHHSPLGQALMGRRAGEQVAVTRGAITTVYAIQAIS